jgi:hypothetical protein
MRLWSLHPQHLDVKGLVALWREALLAKHVLMGKTKGYKHHPQLTRFRATDRPVDAINQYLAIVHEEATVRGYKFNRRKVNWKFKPATITVTRGQVKYETAHLLKKLKRRDKAQFLITSKLMRLAPHPIFRIVKGDIAEWEVV